MQEGHRFEDRGEIGRGGMSSVRRVFDRDIGRDVAVKSVAPASDAAALDELLAEARIVGGLEHPNIVPVYDWLRSAPGDARLVMRLVEGPTLATLLAEESEPPVLGLRLERLLNIFLRICDAVAFAHTRGVIHCDINPRNVMVGSHGQVYLMDWGLALVRRTAQRTGPPGVGYVIGGTPAYMAPEQARGTVGEIDERTDVYGLGAMLYEFLTLRAPHAAADVPNALASAQRGSVPAPDDVVPNRLVPAALSAIAMRALAAEREARHPSVVTLKTDVENFVRAGGWFAARHFPAGALILREGDPSDVAYIVTQGRCEVSRTTSSGERTRLRVVGPGEIFGEVGLVTSTPRLADVHALSDVTALLVTPDALERELSRSGWVRGFIAAAVTRFAELDLAQRRE
jgi:serine/threonine-protein kinase